MKLTCSRLICLIVPAATSRTPGLAPPIQGPELPSSQVDEFPCKPAALLDPGTDSRWIGLGHDTRRLRCAGQAKYTGLHALRHFYASWLINPEKNGGQNLPPKVVQERLGHASITMTYDRYGHLFPRGDDAAQIDAAELKLVG